MRRGAILVAQAARTGTSQLVVAPAAATGLQKCKTRMVVLGSGWGAVSFLKNLDQRAFADDGPHELVVISPRNYFLFTPLLPSAMAGTVEERSLVAPIRDVINGKGRYYEACCIDIDPFARILTCQKQSEELGGNGASSMGPSGSDIFEVSYDVLLLSVGSMNSSFGTPGVEEHCWFMKTMEDAHNLRVHISKCIEMAGLPSTKAEERRRMLKFVVVGGGPTEVEVAAELHDLVAEDVARLYPDIKDEVVITMVHSHDMVLNAFHEDVAKYASKLLAREGVQLVMNSSVLAVEDGIVHVKRKDGILLDLEYGTCVWATGISAHPLVTKLRGKLGEEAQGNRRGLVVDPHLRVLGAAGTIMALGDAAQTNQAKAAQAAQALFEAADSDQDGRVSKKELQELLMQAKAEYPQLGDLAAQLQGGLPGTAERLLFPNSAAQAVIDKHMASIEVGLNLEAFTALLSDADKATHPLPPTAQVARQQGEYLAALFSRRLVHKQGAAEEAQDGAAAPPPAVQLDSAAAPFTYFHLGCLAYLGMNRAVMQLPTAFPIAVLKGWLAAHVWRALELLLQVSARNRWMVYNDWLRTKVFGRNLSDH